MKRFFKDNQGMTLIELLVAITILGLVATPLLHGFLTSAHTEVKARKMGEVTSVAQNVMEVVEGNEFDDIVVEKIEDSYIIFETATNNNVDEQYYSLVESYEPYGMDKPYAEDYHIGLKNYEFMGKKYDVMVDISASEYTEFNNNDKLSVYSKMDRIYLIPETDVNVIKEEIPKRTITMVVDRNDEDGRDFISIKVKYEIEGTYEVTEFEEYRYEVHDGKMPSIYLLYHPSYTKYAGRLLWTDDTIKIVNPKDVPFDLYIIKQRNHDLSETDMIDLEDASRCYVEQSLTEYKWNEGKIGAKIYTNLLENLGDEDSSRKPEVNYSVKYIENETEVSATGTLYAFQTKEEARKRIYQVDVKVFEEGKNFEGDPLGTLTGAILK